MKIPGLLGFFLVLATSGWAQTTVWRAADNPHVVTGTYTVAAGETLVLEPGVEVRLEQSATLHVLGRLEGAGSLAARITIRGDGRLQTAGSLDLSFADIKSMTVPDNNGVLVFRDCRFSEDGWIFDGGILQFQGDRAPYVQLDRCSFTGDGSYSSASLYVADCTVVVRDTSFTNASFLNVSPGYLFVDRVTSIGSTEFGLRLGSDSDLFINNVSVTNATEGGLQLAGDTRNGSNVLIGPDVTLQGNGYPVHLTKSGLHPESSIPVSGNRNNLIRATEFAGGGGFWPNLGIPYYVEGSPLEIGELLWIQPGVVVKMAPYSYILDYSTADGLRAFGTEAQPILFERADPAHPWYSLIAKREQGGRIRHAIVDGSSDGVQGGVWYLENIIFRNNRIATEGGTWVSGSQYLNNDIGHSASGVLNNLANPNAFEGNRIGVSEAGDARNVWWGSPTGPRNPRNPGGTGDVLEDAYYTEFQPFLTARPDFSDAPPEVKLARPSYQLHPGTKVTLRWDSKDDGRIVAHKILFSPVSSYPSAFQEVATLPADQQTYEWTVPAIGFQVAGADAWIRVVAMDSSGKEGFDEWELMIPTNTIRGEVTYDITAGQTFQSGEMPPPLETVNVDRYTPRGESYVEVIGAPNRRLHGRGMGHGMPFVSTDTARFVVSYGTGKNRQTYWYSPIFKIRPDAQLGDAPPTISLTTPQTAQDFPPGSVIPITWNASDDEGLRSFDIVASYDGARTWQPVIGDLPGSARSYDWQTAPGTGCSDLRIMVIATDWRFQTSSDGGDRVFTTDGGVPSPALATLSLNPRAIGSGASSQGVVTLSAPAPAGGALVTIGHNGYRLITAPANITIPAGATSGTFPINTTNIEASTIIDISATSGSVTQTQQLELSLKLTNLNMPSSVPGGSTVTGSVALSGAAPAGGSVVSLASADPSVMSVPSSVTVLEGQQSASFSGTAQSVSAQRSIVISGEYGGAVKETTVTITPSTVPPAPTPTPTPTATPSPAPVATPTPSPTPSPAPQPTPTPAATPSPAPSATPTAAQPLNIATRGRTESGDNTMIGGFIITGNVPKKVVVRAIGPSLPNSLSNALSDPELELRGPDGLVIRNDNWRDDSAQAAEITSNRVAPAHELESAIAVTLAPGSYTAAVTGKNGVSGVALVEVYDLDAGGDSKLANISTRGLVQSADDVLIGGFILGSGSENTRVLLRASGPSLANAGIKNPLADPTLELRDSQGALLRSNDDWKEEQAAEIEATTIAPLMDSEAAIVDDLPPGAYTAIVAGKGAGGVGLIEIYNLR